MRKKLLHHPLARYIFVGGFSYLIELAVLLTLHRVINFSVELSTAIAFWVGLIVSFILQKHLAFRDYQKTVSSISGQLGKYGILVGFNYLFTIFIVSIFSSRLILLSRTLALVIVTFWNYFIYKKYIFTKKVSRNNLSIKMTKDYLFSLIKSRGVKIGLFLSLPIIVFFWQYLATGNKILGGDFDYYIQQYEAARISILHFHQFPLWNPWLSGGVPLFNNPQFGLCSLQTFFSILFGTVIGIKLAYVSYALLGFWGMYLLGRRHLRAPVYRSAVIGYIWIFNGFFAGHGIWHYTFTSFFLLPWLIYFFQERQKKYSWIGLGITAAVIVFSSIHYAFLMLSLIMAIMVVLSSMNISVKNRAFTFSLRLSSQDLWFYVKSGLLLLSIASYQFLTTYRFVSHNQRLIEVSSEIPPSVTVIFQAIFAPIGTLIKSTPKTAWGWGEYSMYIGLGSGLAILAIVIILIRKLWERNLHFTNDFTVPNTVKLVSLVGILSFILALGNFASFSPYNLLHHLPGFTQTRVPSRWAIFSVFAILILLLSWKKNVRLINTLLTIATVELFICYGPLRPGLNWFVVPSTKFSPTYSSYDNKKRHLDVNGDTDLRNSYFYTTSQNIGQTYADDSLINTLSGYPPLATTRCSENSDPVCSFVISKNANIDYWSPNKIIITRTGPGLIELNMNVDNGWRINGSYPFIAARNLDPSRRFLLSSESSRYTIEYSPKGSPSWIRWKITKFLD